MRKFFTIILIIFLPFFLLLTSFQINTFDQDFYLKSYKSYGVLDVTGKSLEELNYVTEDLLMYLEDDFVTEEILSPYFNEREIKHMEDVKFLFTYGFKIKNVALLLSAISVIWFLFNNKVKSLGKSIFYGSFIWWGIMLLLFIVSITNFNKYFTYFHLIFFDNDLWILDPDTDLLIQMLPESFFVSMFTRIVLFFVIILAIIQLIGFILMKRGKDKYGGFLKFKGLFEKS